MSIYENAKISLLKMKIKTLSEKSKKENRFSLFHTRYFVENLSKATVYNDLKSLFDIFVNIDKNFGDSLPYNIGVSIDKLIESNCVFIHRTKLFYDGEINGIPNSSSLASIMNDGLKNYGHLNSSGGISVSYPPISLTMSALSGIAGFINLVSSYKDNNTVIIAVFPKEFFDENEEIRDESLYESMYDMVDGTPAVKPKFIVGALVKKEDGKWKLYTRDEIVENLVNKINSK